MIRLLIALVLVLAVVTAVAVGEKGLPDDHDDDPPTTVKTSATTAPFLDLPAPTTTSTVAPTTTTTAVARTAPTVHAASASSPVAKPDQARTEDGAWSCGGDLPPCWVLNRENPNRDLTVYNGGCHHPAGYTGSNNPCNGRKASTASGKWQFVRSTWNRFGGYLNAADAPWQVQDEKARQLWAGGRGCSHWAAC